jgi:hypothetical protein
MTRTLALTLAALALVAGCDYYSSEARQDRNNAARPTTTTTVEPPTTTIAPTTTTTVEPPAPSEDSAGMWDADSRGNRRYDPDAFDPDVDGNGVRDPGGVAVNGPDGVYHAGLPCYLDFDDMTPSSPDMQPAYDRARARYCEEDGS